MLKKKYVFEHIESCIYYIIFPRKTKSRRRTRKPPPAITPEKIIRKSGNFSHASLSSVKKGSQHVKTKSFFLWFLVNIYSVVNSIYCLVWYGVFINVVFSIPSVLFLIYWNCSYSDLYLVIKFQSEIFVGKMCKKQPIKAELQYSVYTIQPYDLLFSICACMIEKWARGIRIQFYSQALTFWSRMHHSIVLKTIECTTVSRLYWRLAFIDPLLFLIIPRSSKACSLVKTLLLSNLFQAKFHFHFAFITKVVFVFLCTRLAVILKLMYPCTSISLYGRFSLIVIVIVKKPQSLDGGALWF